MAKAKTTGSEKPAAKPRAPRKPAAIASDAVNKQKEGATAPSFLPVDKAPAGDDTDSAVSALATEQAAAAQPDAVDDAAAGTSTAPDQATEALARVVVVGSGDRFFPGMGRFPLDWKPAQTPAESTLVEALQSRAWGLPDITDFPAELTLVNNTRNVLVVRPLNTRLSQYGTKTVQCQTAKQYDAIKREFKSRAVRERWDSDTGLQVKHGEDQR